MKLFLFKIGARRQKAAQFIGAVRRALVLAFNEERQNRGVTREQLANSLSINKSVVTRRLNGSSNLTLRSVAEMADALGYEINFSLQKPTMPPGSNILPKNKPEFWTVSKDADLRISAPPGVKIVSGKMSATA